MADNKRNVSRDDRMRRTFGAAPRDIPKVKKFAEWLLADEPVDITEFAVNEVSTVKMFLVLAHHGVFMPPENRRAGRYNLGQRDLLRLRDLCFLQLHAWERTLGDELIKPWEWILARVESELFRSQFDAPEETQRTQEDSYKKRIAAHLRPLGKLEFSLNTEHPYDWRGTYAELRSLYDAIYPFTKQSLKSFCAEFEKDGKGVSYGALRNAANHPAHEGLPSKVLRDIHRLFERDEPLRRPR